jgi:hypothetical protein
LRRQNSLWGTTKAKIILSFRLKEDNLDLPWLSWYLGWRRNLLLGLVPMLMLLGRVWRCALRRCVWSEKRHLGSLENSRSKTWIWHWWEKKSTC